MDNQINRESKTPEPHKDSNARNFQGLERKVPIRAIQSFLRTNYRNHIELSAIADNKANIMISVNSILISVLITLLSYRNIGETNPKILLPVVIFLVSGLFSLLFAVLAARPKVTRLPFQDTTRDLSRSSLVFFGNFVQLDLPSYEKAMDQLFRDGELLYGNMIRDMYYLGRVLDRKYRFLTVSYTVFMVGFLTSVAIFITTLFL
jgi:hypothetical protein